MGARRIVAVVALVWVVLAAVYALKVWHAQGVCADLGGQWDPEPWLGDCKFIEKSTASRRLSSLFSS